MATEAAISAGLSLATKSKSSGTVQPLNSGVNLSPVNVSFGSVIYSDGGAVTNSSGGLPTPASTLANGITGAVTGGSSSLILLVVAVGFLILVLTHRKK